MVLLADAHVHPFGSDAPRPQDLAAHFPEAVAMAEAFGSRVGRRSWDFWVR